MKNSDKIPESLAVKHDLESITNKRDQNLSFLIILDLDDLKITYLNPIVKKYCGIDAKHFLLGEKDFYSDLLHPEDYPSYIEHLISCKNLQPGETKEITVRLKNRFDDYTHFCFQDRLYNWSLNGEKNSLLSQARKLNVAPTFKKQENLCDHLPDPDPLQSKYEPVLNSMEEAYCIIEMIYNSAEKPVDFLIVECNPAYKKYLNLKYDKDLEKISGRTIREIIPNYEEAWFKKYETVALTGKTMRLEEFSDDLNKGYLDIYGCETEDNLCRRVILLYKNFTQKKQVSNALVKKEQKLKGTATREKQKLVEKTQLLQTIFDTTNLALAVFETLYDDKGKVIDFKFKQVNKVLRDLYLNDNVVGSTYKQTTHYGVALGVFDGFVKVMETGEVMDKEFYLDNAEYKNWFRIIARSHKTLLLVSIEDITKRKEEAQKLKEAMRFNRQLVQTSPNTILIINLDSFKVRYINQDLHTPTGLTKELIMDVSLPEILDHLHPRDREKIMEFHRKLLKCAEDEILETEFRLKARESEWEWFNARGKVFNRKNEDWVEEYVLVVRNISEEKTTQRALINAEKLSIQGEVARTLAHELRNPLASIRMATDVIKYKLDDTQKEALGNYMDILTRSTQVLNNLVSNLMNASNYSPAVLEEIDLAECIDYTLEQAADRIYLTGIKVIKNYKGPYKILADKEKLNIALLNIVVNASEATNPQEGIIEISIKEHKTDFMLSISDNGHGLEQEQIDRLFEAFYTSKASGAGIGLTSVKNILEEHDAQINVISTPGKGTTFKLFFPNIDIR